MPADFVRPPIDPKILESEPEMVNGYAKLDFDRLADFPFTLLPFDPSIPIPGTPSPSLVLQIPTAIKKFDGKKVIVTGFMLEGTKMDQGRLTELILTRFVMHELYPNASGPGPVPSNRAISYSLGLHGPKLYGNEYVIVRNPNGMNPPRDKLITASGTLHVQEQFENGYLSASTSSTRKRSQRRSREVGLMAERPG